MIWLLSILSGILGRAGGAQGYNTKYRDLCIPAILVGYISLHTGWSWWLLLLFISTMGSLTTYWDWLFDEDNLWFSGFITGMALIPAVFIGVGINFILIRAIILTLIWGLLNKYMPRKLLFWRGDVANEFLRYFAVIITLIGV